MEAKKYNSGKNLIFFCSSIHPRYVWMGKSHPGPSSLNNVATWAIKIQMQSNLPDSEMTTDGLDGSCLGIELLLKAVLFQPAIQSRRR